MNDSMAGLVGMTALGTTGTGTTYWLTQINPWLAFGSGILTIFFMSWSLFRMWKPKKPSGRWK
jgi:ABC-type nickel/cobalt efflux system permease component RcnA